MITTIKLSRESLFLQVILKGKEILDSLLCMYCVYAYIVSRQTYLCITYVMLYYMAMLATHSALNSMSFTSYTSQCSQHSFTFDQVLM